jgi:uncharacterized membrane protein
MNSAIYIALPMLAFCGALMFLLPSLSPRRYFFAITVPPDFASSEPGRAALRRYHAILTAGVLLSVVPVWALAGDEPDLAVVLALLLPSLAGMVCFLLTRSRVSQYSVSGAPVREAQLSTGPEHLPRWILLALPPFAAPLAAAAYLRAHWNEIPQRFPIHYDLAGVPNRWVPKTAHAVYGPVLFEAGFMLLLLLLSLGAFYGARRGPQRIAVLKMIVATLYFLAYIFTAMSLLALVPIPLESHLVVTAVFAIGVLVWSYKMVRDPKMPVDNTPDEYWRLGMIYCNPNDPAVFVQKRIGFGYTLNFGNPVAWVGFGLFMLAMFGGVLLLL